MRQEEKIASAKQVGTSYTVPVPGGKRNAGNWKQGARWIALVSNVARGKRAGHTV